MRCSRVEVFGKVDTIVVGVIGPFWHKWFCVHGVAQKQDASVTTGVR
jgi:hypothetical protein